MTSKTKHAVQKMHRPGEGVLVDIVRSNNAQGQITQFAANLSMVPVPDRRYAADVVWVVADENIVKLVFGQKKISGPELRSLVVIHMTFDAIHQFVSSVDAVESGMTELRSKLPKMTLQGFSGEPEQTVALAVSMIVAGFSGAESCLDCYHSSPFSLQNAGQSGKLALEPVVRVTLPTSLFFALHSKLKSLTKDLPSLVEEMQS